ncbi:MAG: hypothetical protein NTX16_12185 [Actinobacteria bacterium]|nr:hypothetical protein [Actinomycetota bacterium]
MPDRIAEAWGAKLYQAPFVLEGGGLGCITQRVPAGEFATAG